MLYFGCRKDYPLNYPKMYNPIQSVIKYFKYYVTASSSQGHGMHSPFVFDFITNVLNDDRNFYAYNEIEKLRLQLLANETTIAIKDFGAGSKNIKNNQRKIAAIAASSLKPKKFSQLLFRMVNYYQPTTIIELGTSLGITTAYLASPKPDAKIITMEGAASIAAVALQGFQQLQLKNIQQVQGNFDDTLPVLINQLNSIDFAFILNTRKAGLDVVELAGCDDVVGSRRQNRGDLIFGVRDTVRRLGMIGKGLGQGAGLVFFESVQLLKEGDEALRIVARLVHVLHAKIVGLRLVGARELEEGKRDGELCGFVDAVAGIGALAENDQRHRGNLGVKALGLLARGVVRNYVRDLVRHNAGKFRLFIAVGDQA